MTKKEKKVLLGEFEGHLEAEALPEAVHAGGERLARVVHEALGQAPEYVLDLCGDSLLGEQMKSLRRPQGSRETVKTVIKAH